MEFVEKILQFLKKTAELSEKGNDIDTINEGVRLEQIKQNILNAKESISQRANDVEQEPRLKEQFRNELKSTVMDQLSLENVNEIPTLEKIVINIGDGKAATEFVPLDPVAQDELKLGGVDPPAPPAPTVTGNDVPVKTEKFAVQTVL